MSIPKPILLLAHTVAFPIVITVAWLMGHANFGHIIISAQVSVIGIQLQKYFWSERDYYEVRRFLFRDGK
jgi:hypothetical protein